MTFTQDGSEDDGKPRVAIITVCRNEAGSIRATIESVLNQTYKRYEYIIIDGASSDGTADIIAEYSSRLAYWVSEPDKGIYDAMNKGVKEASAEYLLFLNGGDRLASVSVLGDVFASVRTAGILYGDVFKDRGGACDLCRYKDYRITAFFLFDHTLPHPGSFIKRTLFERVGTYDTSFRLSGDYDFFLRAFVRGKSTAEYLPIPISIFDTGGISQDAKWRTVRRREDARARRKTYAPLEYGLISAVKFLHNLVVYRPRRKILSLLDKS